MSQVDFLLGSKGEGGGGGDARGERKGVLSLAHDLDREHSVERIEASAPRQEQARSPRQSRSFCRGTQVRSEFPLWVS